MQRHPAAGATGPFPVLAALLASLDRSDSVADLTWLGRYLAGLVGKEPAWSYNYMVGVLHGNKGMAPSALLRRAVDAALAHADGEPSAAALFDARPVLVPPSVAWPSAVQVVGPVLDCARPGCPGRFIRNSARRKYCYVCSPPGGG